MSFILISGTKRHSNLRGMNQLKFHYQTLLCLSVYCSTSCPEYFPHLKTSQFLVKGCKIKKSFFEQGGIFIVPQMTRPRSCGLTHRTTVAVYDKQVLLTSYYNIDSIVTSFETKEITCLLAYVDLFCRRTPKEVGVYDDMQGWTFKNWLNF